MHQHCFTYGSLMCSDIMAAVCGLPDEFLSARPALLAGFARHPVIGETYPGMIPCPGSAVPGVAYLDVPEATWSRLDRFEGEMYERQSVLVRLDNGSALRAQAYIFRPEFANRLVAGEWDFAAFLRDAKVRFTELYLGFRQL